jgi:two-component system phosphate regulon sensor histidine kinase PhoR
VRLSLGREGPHALLRITDTGIGIATAHQSGLFTKFFREPNATAPAIPGIGLGLVITKAIVDAHGGTIEFDSEEGRGTSVLVRLPFVPIGPLPEAPEQRVLADASDGPA